MKKSHVVDKIHRLVHEFLTNSEIDLTKTFLLAVSGGQDSFTLLYALHHLRPILNLRLCGAHLNHGLRGQQGVEDARFVEEAFRQLNIPATIGQADVASVRVRYRLSLEEAARKVRYGFLYKAAQDTDTSYVVLGHTADDQAETVLLNLIRGAGLTGLRGMRPVSSWRPDKKSPPTTLLRPLLGITREETGAYCLAAGLQPRQDESNLSPAFTRNRLRNSLMPSLRAFNPSIRNTLLRMSRSVETDLAQIEREVQGVWPNVVAEERSCLTINRAAFSELPPSLQFHLLRKAVSEIKGDLDDISHRHVESMARLMGGRTGKRLSLPDNIVFSVGYKEAVLNAGEGLESHLALKPIEEHRLTLPGESAIPGWRITTIVTTPPKALPRANALTAYLDSENLGKDLRVRSRKAGDRFLPLGMLQDKKLQDFMTDAKIPRTHRDVTPLVVSSKGIAWVVGHRIAEWAKLRKESQKVVCIEFQRTE